jgi:hypothetical protein
MFACDYEIEDEENHIDAYFRVLWRFSGSPVP